MENKNMIEEIYNEITNKLSRAEYKMLTSFTANQQDYFGAYVIPVTSSILGVPMWKMIGRLIQIRKKAGSFGSDMFTLRLVDASITPWENESFWIIPERYKARLDDLFRESLLDDNWDDSIENSLGAIGINYCDNPGKRYIGFIIPSEPAEIDEVNIENSNKVELSFELDKDTLLICCNKNSEYLSGVGDGEEWSEEINESFDIDMEQAKDLRDLLNRIIK